MTASALSSLVFDCEVALQVDDAVPESSSKLVVDADTVARRLEMLSTASCPFAHCFKSLRHEFLVVHGSGDFCGMEFLVEPSLRQQFAIPHPSPEYAFVLAAAPDVFVGGSCRLVPIVQLLCAMMADSFERQGLALPPWRKEAAMLSKWLPQPNRMRDTRVPSAAPSSPLPALPSPPPAPATPPPPSAPPAAASSPAVNRRVRQATHGYILPSRAQDLMRTPEALGVHRADSNSSDDSCVDDACDTAMGGCSPVSVLPLPQQPRPAAALAQFGFNLGGPVSSCENSRFPPRPPTTSVHGFLPRTACVQEPAGDDELGLELGLELEDVASGSARSADCTCTGFLADTAAVVAAFGRGGCYGGDGNANGGADDSGCDSAESSRSNVICSGPCGVSAGSGSGSACSRTGLLSMQLLQRQQSASAAATACQAPFASPSSPSSPAATAEGAAARIETRPPVHPGEMAIRVVKLYQVGFTVPQQQAQPQQAPQQLPQQPPQQQPTPQQQEGRKQGQQQAQQQPQQQGHKRAAHLPWRAFYRAA